MFVQHSVMSRKSFLGIEGSHYDDIIRRYKDNTDNKPDTLGAQLKALQTIGFKEVDCFYSRFGSVGRQYAEMLVCMRTYKDITFLACAYIAETA